MGADLAARDQEIARLRGEIERRDQQLEQLTGPSAVDRAEQLRRELEAAQGLGERWREAAYKTAQELGAKSQQLAERYQSQLERLTTAIEDLRVVYDHEKARLVEECAQAQAESRARLEAMAGLEAQAATLSQTIAALQAERDALAATADLHQDKSKRKSRRIEQLEAQIAALEAERRKMRESVAWRLTAPVRAVGAGFSSAGRGAARLRRGLSSK